MSLMIVFEAGPSKVESCSCGGDKLWLLFRTYQSIYSQHILLRCAAALLPSPKSSTPMSVPEIT